MSDRVGIPDGWEYDEELDLYYRTHGGTVRAVVSCALSHEYWRWEVMSADNLVGSGWAETLPSATYNVDATVRSM